jgi:hypothetical protein
MLVVPTWMCQVSAGSFSIAIMQLTDTMEGTAAARNGRAEVTTIRLMALFRMTA